MLRSERGAAGLASMLMVLLILGALYLGYAGMPDFRAKRGTGPAQVEAARDVACKMQRQQIERDIEVWKIDHSDEEPSLAALRSSGINIPACPERGTYDVHGSSVVCSVHR
jgi:competence protein ComGC